MFAGLFGSLFFEIAFLVVFNFRPGNPYRDMLWFAILPFTTFAPGAPALAESPDARQEAGGLHQPEQK